MSTCTPNLKNSFFTICEIITFKVEEKIFFPSAQGEQQCFGGQNNHFFTPKGQWQSKQLFAILQFLQLFEHVDMDFSVFQKLKFLYVEEALEHVFTVWIFNPRIFHMLFLLSKNSLCM
jgi:hypothetical protein